MYGFLALALMKRSIWLSTLRATPGTRARPLREEIYNRRASPRIASSSVSSYPAVAPRNHGESGHSPSSKASRRRSARQASVACPSPSTRLARSATGPSGPLIVELSGVDETEGVRDEIGPGPGSVEQRQVEALQRLERDRRVAEARGRRAGKGVARRKRPGARALLKPGRADDRRARHRAKPGHDELDKPRGDPLAHVRFGRRDRREVLEARRARQSRDQLPDRAGRGLVRDRHAVVAVADPPGGAALRRRARGQSRRGDEMETVERDAAAAMDRVRTVAPHDQGFAKDTAAEDVDILLAGPLVAGSERGDRVRRRRRHGADEIGRDVAFARDRRARAGRALR